MRYLIAILMISMTSCTSGISQQPSEEAKKEEEFQKVLNMAKEQQIKNQQIMKAADEKTNHVITKTSEQIVTLKQEVKQLKQELNETTVKPNTGTKFKLLPIANGTEDKQ